MDVDDEDRRAVEAIVTAVVAGPPGPRLLLFDFDGTLVEFASVPGSVKLPADRRRWLEALAARQDAVPGFISGRRLDDLQARIDVAGAWYAGLHGLEIAVPGEAVLRHPAFDEAAPFALDLANRFAASLRWPGVWIEYKGPSVAVHWRDAAPADGVEARTAFLAAVSTSAAARFRVLDGDRVCEAVPDVPWHKGRAVETMQRRLAGRAGLSPWTLFAGDDWTDEDAFEALGDAGVTVCVGDRPSAAKFRLRDPAGVERLLAALARAPSLGPPPAPHKV